MSEKKNSLGRKSIIMLAILGLILMIGTGLAGGIQLYRQNMETLRAAAQTYADMLGFQILNTDIDGILKHEQEIRDLYKKALAYLEAHDGTVDDEEIWQIAGKDVGEETLAMNRLWLETGTFVLGFGNIFKDIRYAYVVVPEEYELIYVWDSGVEDSEKDLPFVHRQYSGKEKGHLMAVMRGDAESVFFTDTLRGELIGTALAPVYDEDGRICAVAAVDVSVSRVQKACLTLLFHIGLAICLIMLISMTVYHYVVRKQIILPIKAISDSMLRFARDSRTKPKPLNIRSGDEIEEIAETFEKMTEDISSYVISIEDLTRERVQNNVEMEVARRIQDGLVPEQCVLEDEGCRIRAMSRPARAVGGDFYDCFRLDEDTVCVFMGDVSGKGITAAIFMGMTKAIIREKLFAGLSPAAALNQANSELYMQNPEFLFATVFAAVLNLQTGELCYANAGHTLPVLLKKEPEYLQTDSGIALGVIEDSNIREDHLQLAIGEGILLYTDGVTDTVNPQRVFFGTDRLLDAVRRLPTGEEQDDDVLFRLSCAVERFRDGSEPFDDMTALALYRTDSSICELPVDLSSLEKIRKIVLGAAGDSIETGKILLVCDEVLANIVAYSGAKTLVFSCKKMDAVLRLSFIDDGIPFDPTAVKEEEVIEDPEHGGMGLTIIRKSSSSIHYERKDGRNRLFMSFRPEL